MPKISERPAPALVGRKEAAMLLGVKPENIYRIEGVPRPLQDRKIKGFAVSTGPLWPRVEIEELAKAVKVAKAQKARELRAAKAAAAKRKRTGRRRAVAAGR